MCNKCTFVLSKHHLHLDLWNSSISVSAQRAAEHPSLVFILHHFWCFVLVSRQGEWIKDVFCLDKDGTVQDLHLCPQAVILFHLSSLAACQTQTRSEGFRGILVKKGRFFRGSVFTLSLTTTNLFSDLLTRIKFIRLTSLISFNDLSRCCCFFYFILTKLLNLRDLKCLWGVGVGVMS